MRGSVAAPRVGGSGPRSRGPIERRLHDPVRSDPKTLARPAPTEEPAARVPSEDPSMRFGSQRHRFVSVRPNAIRALARAVRPPSSSRVLGSSRVRKASPRHLVPQRLEGSRARVNEASRLGSLRARSLAPTDSASCRDGSGAFDSPTRARPRSPRTAPTHSTLSLYASRSRRQRGTSIAHVRALP